MKKEVKIGLIGIIAIGLLIFGINYLKGVRMLQAIQAIIMWNIPTSTGWPYPAQSLPAATKLVW